MQQRQLRLGDILDDYCPRERRVTNHAVVAMVGEDVKQTRCTTCDAEHEYKHAKVPRQRKKSDTPAALTAQIVAGAPKRVVHDQPTVVEESVVTATVPPAEDEEIVVVEPAAAEEPVAASPDETPSAETEPEADAEAEPGDDTRDDSEGPVHRPLIRATLPRQEGQPPPARPTPDFTIRQPGGRQNRFRPRHQRGGQGQPFFGNRGNGNIGPMRSGSMSRQQGGGRPQGTATGRPGRHQGQGRKRSK